MMNCTILLSMWLIKCQIERLHRFCSLKRTFCIYKWWQWHHPLTSLSPRIFFQSFNLPLTFITMTDSLAESKLHLKPRILVTYQNLSYLRPFLFLIQEMYDFWENHSFVLYLREKSTTGCTETSITRKSPHRKLKLLRRSLSDWLEK